MSYWGFAMLFDFTCNLEFSGLLTGTFVTGLVNFANLLPSTLASRPSHGIGEWNKDLWLSFPRVESSEEENHFPKCQIRYDEDCCSRR